MTHEEFWTLTPAELSARCRAARRRRNRDVALFAWGVGQLLGPHAKDLNLRDVILNAPGYDPDVEDLTG